MDSPNLTRRETRAADTPSLFAAHGDRARRPRVETLVSPLLAALESRGGWVAGAVLAQDLGVTDRHVRAAASASRGLVLGGQRGCCLTRNASSREVDRMTGFLLGQSTAMKRRAIEIEAVRHGKWVTR